jgi:hypothetical protein
MTGRPPPSDERAQIRELLQLLKAVRCIDSTVFVEVAADTFEDFCGTAEVVCDDSGSPDFRAKHVLSVSKPSRHPGSGVDVVLWTEARRHLRVA